MSDGQGGDGDAEGPSGVASGGGGDERRAADVAPAEDSPPERPDVEPLTVERTGDAAPGGAGASGDAGASGTTGDTDTATPDTELRVAFWRLVIVFNIALLAAWLGFLLAVFEGRYRDGAGLVGVGVLAGAYGYWRYRRVTGAEGD